MLCRWIRLDKETPLFQLICANTKRKPLPFPHSQFLAEVCQEYLRHHPELTLYASQLSTRASILYKYA